MRSSTPAGLGVGDHVGEGPQPHAWLVGHGEAARGQQRPDLADRAGNVERSTPYSTAKAWCGSMLRLAKRLLRQVLEVLAEPLAAGVPVAVLEPSCAAVFRDELGNLFPTDEQQVLTRLGLAAEVLDAGCCGLAGSFGYERGEHYRVSVQAASGCCLTW